MAGKSKIDEDITSPTNVMKARWAVRVYSETGKSEINARGLHYFALGRDDFPLFSGSNGVVKGTRVYGDSDYAALTSWISSAKRLGLVRWDAIPDESVDEQGALVFEPTHREFSHEYTAGMSEYVLGEVRDHLERQHLVEKYDSVKRGPAISHGTLD